MCQQGSDMPNPDYCMDYIIEDRELSIHGIADGMGFLLR